MSQEEAIHWADMTAERIIKQCGDKELYTLASGITPSGVVHFGNFREVMTVDIVARGLRKKGKKVRFIFSWDDYDTFRKVPLNLPKQEELKKYMFQPIVDTPDPYGEHGSYAEHHEHNFEQQLAKMGIEVEPLYQAKKYRAGTYKTSIKRALDRRDEIAAILNKYRSEPLSADWLPTSVYCEKCNRDSEIKDEKWDGQFLSYSCGCGHSGKEDINTTSRIKLGWRVDWPMRWAFEKVDFEPGGKDHSSQGGSYTTAKEIVEIFDWKTPVYLQYDFVSFKGMGGKMSSSKGNLVTVNDVLNVYEPEMVRWIFASYKSNTDFAVSFDLDVIKVYEDFDRMERQAFGVEEAPEKKAAMAKRVYDLAAIGAVPTTMPFQPSFRHLTNILQIHDGDIVKARSFYESEIKNERDERRFRERSQCALFWLKEYAPEDFKFALNRTAPQIELNDKNRAFLQQLVGLLESAEAKSLDDTGLHEKMYEFMNAAEIKPGELFPVVYEILISKQRGPKLAGFILTIGLEKTATLLKSIL
ncbi:MAG: lysine--tRNA ligase [Bdellovibrio sp. CG12_big_fil_rev_8_21_14_0_65_39_13]|nr:MAG: lysine--tRNA ligase [Bdellovibrio sp. CG22_combo_CG10-13_8_21_14_all_39_27]PIQ57785.1 MAG: lysine--tRNA ligase [Bdellovibrio sp. CG12_big_fil_rev_8_21_14_0_65_39_13]PIR34659.1 MAG: lysine--tRNA ligase [Bdellovibrio sp. CG11_big_fil_rev_8_21_14_0_20_39_38]